MASDAVVFGRQEPGILWTPEYSSTAVDDAVGVSELAGLHLDPWQQTCLRHGLGEKPDGKWNALEVCIVVPRQNGKGAIIAARQLAGLFVFKEKLIIHTAHEVKTAKVAFNRIVELVENCDVLRRKVKKVINGKGEEGIELLDGRKLQFLSRTNSSGRGFSCDCLLLDESMILNEEAIGALFPTMSAMPNPQIWYLGSAGLGQKSTQLAKLRKRGLAGDDDSLVYLEWSVNVHESTCPPGCTAHYAVDDTQAAINSNPAMGYRPNLTPEYVAKELRAMGPSQYAVERLCVGDYPDEDLQDRPFSIAEWNALANRDSEAGKDIVFAVDVPPDRSLATIVAYSQGAKGRGHVEVVDRRIGTEWVPERLAQLRDSWSTVAVVIDANGPAASLATRIQAEGFDIANEPQSWGSLIMISATEMRAACGQLVDSIRNEDFRHLGDDVLSTAVASACVRAVGDSWVFTRRKSTGDISALVATTIARYTFKKWLDLLSDYDVLESAF